MKATWRLGWGRNRWNGCDYDGGGDYTKTFRIKGRTIIAETFREMKWDADEDITTVSTDWRLTICEGDKTLHEQRYPKMKDAMIAAKEFVDGL